eukprot:TRINITY_DN11819_c0_g1_i1.p1 TRINITY_DN11819_c0_g1~~TRINITY_DN11819_c0_g1_i1.p1  ORF type:complete len:327 (+),score=58.43 TRINITY_DN11819_c0_g1_i1:1-981(+)
MMVADRCATCGVVLDKPLRCSRCKTSIYCNKECQKQHWKEHKRLCRPVSTDQATAAKPRLFKQRLCRESYKSFPNVNWIPCTSRQRADTPAPNLLVLLHGTGDTEQGFGRLAESMAIPGMEALSLRAPFPVPYYDGYSWYAVYEDDGNLIEPLPSERRRVASLQHTRKLLHQLLDELRHDGWHMRGVFLMGYGTGAIAAMDAALSYGDLLGGTIAMSGGCFLEEYNQLDLDSLLSELAWKQKELPLLVTHNPSEHGLAVEMAVSQATLLKAWNDKVTYETYSRPGLLKSQEEVKTLFAYLSPLMITSLHEMALNGEVEEVANIEKQ